LLDIAFNYKKFNSKRVKQIAEEHAEELEKYYQRIIASTKSEIEKFNNNLNNKLENYQELSNRLIKLEEQQKEIIDNNIIIQNKYVEATKIIKELEDEIKKYKGTLHNKVKQIVRLKTKSGIELNENEKKVFEEINKKGRI
jgi:septal ring factor EnvC (AmiA/AmiB activator)